MRQIVCAVVLIAVACGSDRDSGEPSKAPEVGVEAPMVAVRLHGVGAAGPVLVRVASFDLMVDGRALPVMHEAREIDLGNSDHAWLVLKFSLPADARELTMAVHFEPFGTIDLGNGAQALDLRGPPLSFSAGAARLGATGKVVIELDVARSLVELGDEVLLIPSFTVRF